MRGLAVCAVQADKASTEALLVEASALIRLQHPNVVRVFGFCREPLMVVMEYVAKGSLSVWIRKCYQHTANGAKLVRFCCVEGTTHFPCASSAFTVQLMCQYVLCRSCADSVTLLPIFERLQEFNYFEE